MKESKDSRSAVRITSIDAHVAGEPLRVITGGFPEIPGRTMLDKRRFAARELDGLRRSVMLEPRGHADMYGCILTQPATSDGDAGVLFMHNAGFSTMCGHGIIGVVKVGIEQGLIHPRAGPETVRLDTPAGRVTARAEMRGGLVRSVSFDNVPSFVLDLDARVDVGSRSGVRYDLAFGGAFYAFVRAAEFDLSIGPASAGALIDAGRAVTRAVTEVRPIEHPEGDADLNFLYGTILTERAAGPVHSRNACIFADGEVDRSPTGTGVSARAAILHARGEIRTGETISIESLIGTAFGVSVVREVRCGGLPAVIPRVRGEAHITGRHEFVIEPDDPLAEGFLIR